jgi:PAS domain S-box-containing protein
VAVERRDEGSASGGGRTAPGTPESGNNREPGRLLGREKFVRQLLRGFPNGSVNVFDRDLRYLLAEGRGLEEEGLTPEALVGKTVGELFPKESAECVEPFYGRAFAGEDVEFELALAGRAYSIFAAPLSEEYGEVRTIIAVAQNITERKRAEDALRTSEHKYRTLVENVADHAIFMLDPDGIVTEWTEGARRMKGYATEEVVGRHFSMFYTPEELASGEPERLLEQAASEGRTEREAWRVAKGGRRIWANEVATAVRDAEGRLVGFTNISRDLTERRALEQERERLRTAELTALAEAAERERVSRELHDRVAHDIGVAHQSLELFSALSESGPERAQERLALAKETTRRALDQTRALSAELKRLQQEELGEGLESAFSRLAEVYVPDGIGMEIFFSGDESAISEPVRTQVYLAMREAVRNAVKHSGCSRIGVTLRALDGELCGLVEDDGEGFDIEAVGRATPSWGVGLRWIRERAEMLGGTLRVDSEPSEGTRVEIRVPLNSQLA